MQIWALVLDTIRETIDKKLFWINLALSLFIVAVLACISFDDKGADILFGWYTFQNADFSTNGRFFRAVISQLLSALFVDYYVGWIGCILGLVCTAGVFPNLMEKGAVDSIVARPLSRWKIFLAKYLGSLFFMAVQATFFVVLAFLVVGWRWKAWFPGLLWSIPLLILLFSYLYCICVAFGIWTRSAVTSLLLTLAVWLMVIAVGQLAFEYVHGSLKLKDRHNLKQATAAIKWILPDTTNIPRIVQRAMDDADPAELVANETADNPFLSRAELEYMMAFEKRMLERPWHYSVGPSLLFEAVVLVLAGWRFARKDF